MRPGIDNDVGPNGLDSRGQTRQIGEIAAKIEAIKIQRDDLTQKSQTTLKLPANLATFAKQKNFDHRDQAPRLPYWV